MFVFSIELVHTPTKGRHNSLSAGTTPRCGSQAPPPSGRVQQLTPVLWPSDLRSVYAIDPLMGQCKVRQRAETSGYSMTVGNLAWRSTEDDLREGVSVVYCLFPGYNFNIGTVFQDYGTIVEVIVMKEPSTGRSRGFGFITFAAPNEAEGAIEHMNNFELVSLPRLLPGPLARETRSFQGGTALRPSFCVLCNQGCCLSAHERLFEFAFPFSFSSSSD